MWPCNHPRYSRRGTRLPSVLTRALSPAYWCVKNPRTLNSSCLYLFSLLRSDGNERDFKVTKKKEAIRNSSVVVEYKKKREGAYSHR